MLYLKKIILPFLMLFMLAAFSFNLPAQDTTSIKPKPVIADSSKANDTTSYKPLESIMEKKEAPAQKFVMKKSPMGAVWRSLAVPGWGQLYTESYWKAPLFFGGAATLIGFIIYYNTQFNVAAQDYQNGVRDSLSTIKLTNLRNIRETYRDYRDITGLYLVGVYILAAVDAYVDAHLFDFNVDDKLSVNLGTNRNFGVSMYVTYRWK